MTLLLLTGGSGGGGGGGGEGSPIGLLLTLTQTGGTPPTPTPTHTRGGFMPELDKAAREKLKRALDAELREKEDVLEKALKTVEAKPRAKRPPKNDKQVRKKAAKVITDAKAKTQEYRRGALAAIDAGMPPPPMDVLGDLIGDLAAIRREEGHNSAVKRAARILKERSAEEIQMQRKRDKDAIILLLM
jgi:hypothetical protein